MADSLAMGDPIIATPLVTPPADKALLENQLRLLHQLLPGLNAPPESLEAALSQMAMALITQTNDNCLTVQYIGGLCT